MRIFLPSETSSIHLEIQFLVTSETCTLADSETAVIYMFTHTFWLQ